jgi:nucleotide-binding universal stress UspA family protein
MKTLLFLTDFSVNATFAAEYGYRLARLIDANIVLCNAINMLDQLPLPEYGDWRLVEEENFQNLSHAALRELKNHLEYHNIKGDAPMISCIDFSAKAKNMIRNTISDCRIDLVVMGTHDSGSLRNILLSNYNRIMITQTTVPLLMIPPATPNTNIERLAFATDLKDIEVDLQHLLTLISLVRQVNADILITHVVRNKVISERAKRQKEMLLSRISNECDYALIYFRFLNSSRVESGLAGLCQTEHISILAVAPGKHNFIEGLISPRLTQKIAKHLSIPLLVFPPKEQYTT